MDEKPGSPWTGDGKRHLYAVVIVQPADIIIRYSIARDPAEAGRIAIASSREKGDLPDGKLPPSAAECFIRQVDDALVLRAAKVLEDEAGSE